MAIRARDQSVLGVLCPSFEPRLTAQSGMFFWKGPLSLVDGSVIDVKVVEVEAEDGLHYYPILAAVSGEVAKLCETPFRSASEAVRALELRMNQEIYESANDGRRGLRHGSADALRWTGELRSRSAWYASHRGGHPVAG